MEASEVSVSPTPSESTGRRAIRAIGQAWAWLFLLGLLVFFSLTGEGFLSAFNLQSILANMAIMLITHNLGVVAEICDEVAVMYLGEMVEQASVDALFHDPLHPYTQALLRSIPKLGVSKSGRLDPITGAVPDPYNRPAGCPFHPRCAQAITEKCNMERSPVFRMTDGRTVRCWQYA